MRISDWSSDVCSSDLPGGGHIFDPRHGFFGSGCPDVAVDIGFGPDRLDKVHEFMRAEGVGIDDPAPFGVDAGRAILARPDAVAPVIEIGEIGRASCRESVCQYV